MFLVNYFFIVININQWFFFCFLKKATNTKLQINIYFKIINKLCMSCKTNSLDPKCILQAEFCDNLGACKTERLDPRICCTSVTNHRKGDLWLFAVLSLKWSPHVAYLLLRLNFLVSKVSQAIFTGLFVEGSRMAWLRIIYCRNPRVSHVTLLVYYWRCRQCPEKWPVPQVSELPWPALHPIKPFKGTIFPVPRGLI